MGREVIGVHIENKSPYAKVKPKIPTNMNQEINPKSPEGNNEVKSCKVKECTSEVPQVEYSHENEDVLAIKSTNLEAGKPEVKSAKVDDHKSSFPDKSSCEAASANVSSENTLQRLSDVTVDKQVCESLTGDETPVSPTASNTKSPCSNKQSQPSTPSMERKHLDDEDNWSITSSTAASVRTNKSRITVGVAPTFTCNERLEKRKEYYAKLEEKRQALEEEKREYEARTKEEEAAAVKQLRKTMKYKANPVPSFYYEKPPPKKELKKLPPTRPVSPKFGRRKSCSHVISSFSEEKVCARASRHSLGSQRERSAPTVTPKKGQLVKDRSKQAKETTKRTPKMTEQTNADLAVQS